MAALSEWRALGVAVVVWDNAGSHRARAVREVGVALVYLPAYWSELNLVARVFCAVRCCVACLDLCRTVQFGATDCAQPMLWAMRHGVEADAFVVYTDNETWAGDVQPVEALWQYRERMGIPAKLVVVGMASTGFSIADPNDAGMLDVVGFDTAAPNAIADFIAAL